MGFFGKTRANHRFGEIFKLRFSVQLNIQIELLPNPRIEKNSLCLDKSIWKGCRIRPVPVSDVTGDGETRNAVPFQDICCREGNYPFIIGLRWLNHLYYFRSGGADFQRNSPLFHMMV